MKKSSPKADNARSSKARRLDPSKSTERDAEPEQEPGREPTAQELQDWMQGNALLKLLIVSVEVLHSSQAADSERDALESKYKESTSSKPGSALQLTRQEALFLRNDVRAQGRTVCAHACARDFRSSPPVECLPQTWFAEASRLKQLADDNRRHVTAVLSRLARWSTARKRWEAVLRRHVQHMMDARSAGEDD